MTNRACVICGEEESDQASHIELPCWNHWVCKDDLADFFVRATENESLYPPRCCDELILLEPFEQLVPQDVQTNFLIKAQGEYQIMQKFRVYCANTSCALFLGPAGHITDTAANVNYAICDSTDCGKVTCVACRTLLVDGIAGHSCELQEVDRKFKETAQEQGYQECACCSRTVELAEACNHITCECGHSFCYVCGRDWPGVHGCPQYGRAVYDEEGYNQDGFHRDTDLNRDGLTRRQQRMREAGQESDDEEGDVEREDREEDMPDWDVLQHLDEETRDVINMLPHNERQDSLEMLRIQLMETRGITFQQPQNNHQVDDDGDDDEEEDVEENSQDHADSESNNENNEQVQGDQAGRQEGQSDDDGLESNAEETDGLELQGQRDEGLADVHPRGYDVFAQSSPEQGSIEEDPMELSDAGSELGWDAPTAPQPPAHL